MENDTKQPYDIEVLLTEDQEEALKYYASIVGEKNKGIEKKILDIDVLIKEIDNYLGNASLHINLLYPPFQVSLLFLLEVNYFEKGEKGLKAEIGYEEINWRNVRDEIPIIKKKFITLLSASECGHGNSKGYMSYYGVHFSKLSFNSFKEIYKDFRIFISLLNDKGLCIVGHEKTFIEIIVNKISEINYNQNMEKYGNFLDDINTLEKAYCKYIDIVGVYEIFNIENLDFFNRYLCIKKIIKSRLDFYFFVNELEKNKGIYLFNLEKVQLQKRIDNNTKPENQMAISDIDKLSGIDFEKFLCDLFEKLAYKVEYTKATNDQGVDLLIYKKTECTAVQAKCHSNSIGNNAIQEVVSGKQFYKANKSMVVTNNYFTSSAIALAETTGTILWDRDKLNEMIKLLY